jgi:hypothetical protein
MPGVVGPRFWVFDDSGQAKAEVTLPNGLPSTDTEALRGILDIGNDWILGVWVDEVKVEYVRMYRLDKGESPNASAGQR